MNEPKCVETPVRLSHSKLWEIQQNYFKTMGVKAWVEQVPFYISSNMFIATQYATLFISAIHDLITKEPALRSETFYFLELGAGTGKFSFCFLRALETILKTHILHDLKYCYIISDVADKNIEYCQTNTSFQPFINAGKLDFAKVDLVENKNIFLINKKINYADLNAKAPLGVVANYVFDCTKMDLFKADKTGVYEIQLGLKSRYKDFNISESKYLDDLHLEYRPNKIDPAHYYEDEILNTLLLDVTQNVKDNEFYFSMPLGAIQFLQTLSKITHDRFLMISGDRGVCDKQDLMATTLHELIAFNGCFSFFVNFYVLQKYLQKSGGDALLSEGDVTFCVNFFAKGVALDDLQFTTHYFKTELTQMGPKEYCDLYSLFSSNAYRFDAESLLSFLKLSQYDPDAFSVICPRLTELYSTLSPYLHREMLLAVQKTEENIYYSEIERDSFNPIAGFYIMDKQYEPAIAALKHSIEVFKKKSEAYRYLGMIYQEKQDIPQALQYFQEAYQHNPHDRFSKQKMLMLMGKPTFNWVFPVLKTILVCGGVVLAFFILSK